MSTKDLGVGSQIRHPKFGEGVVVATDASFYKIYYGSLTTFNGLFADKGDYFKGAGKED